MKKLQLSLDGEIKDFIAEKVQGRLWIHYQGETYSYEAKSLLDDSGQVEVGDPNQIQAPMPGKVIKILKQEGDGVESGETVIALEAMKMEYNLKAISSARVEKLHCKEGDQVSLGTKLVSLKPEDVDA